MITVNEIKKKSENVYEEYLRSIINNEVFFPKVIRSNKSISSDFNEMRKELSQIIEYSKDRRGYGYTISYKQVNTRQHGNQSIPDEISFQLESDFLKYLHKEKEAQQFRKDAHLIINQYPKLRDWLVRFPLKVIDNNDKWVDLLKVCDYFKSYPKPNLYLRELPINVHTKFIENNQGVIKELLNILISDHVNIEEKEFEKRFNLKYAEPQIRFKVLDKQIAKRFFSGIDDIAIPVSQFESLNLPLDRAIVLENKTTFYTALTLPVMNSAIVIFGSGYSVGNLKNVKWFENIELFYWGDIDVQGFEILSQFRGYFQHAKSVLMDTVTFERFFENDLGTPTTVNTVLNLTNKEQELYDVLKAKNWRLEQEKISYEYVNNYFLKLL